MGKFFLRGEKFFQYLYNSAESINQFFFLLFICIHKTEGIYIVKNIKLYIGEGQDVKHSFSYCINHNQLKCVCNERIFHIEYLV